MPTRSLLFVALLLGVWGCGDPVEVNPPALDDVLPGSYDLDAIDGAPVVDPVVVVPDGICVFTDSAGVDHTGDFTMLSGPGGQIRFEAPDAFFMEEILTFRCVAPTATNLHVMTTTITGTYELVLARLFIRDIDNSMHPNRFFGGSVYPNEAATAFDSVVVVIDRGMGRSSLRFKSPPRSLIRTEMAK